MQPTPFPPPNYEQAVSAIPGITVWQPKAAAATVDAPKTYTCPQCGATTRYDIAVGGVTCEHCGYAQPAAGSDLAAQIGRKAQEFEFTLETLSQAEQGWGVERRELSCDNCGASLTLPENVITATCPFCASNKVNVRTASAEQLRPRFLVPFKIQPEEIRQRALAWLGKGWFHPSELSTTAVVERLSGVYLPFWTFDAVITASWKAQVGHERHVRYYDSGSKSWKTRTVIDWKWEDGQVKVTIDDQVISGSSRLSRLILNRLAPFNLNELVAYTPDYLAGWQAQAYDVTLPQAWEEGKASMRESAKQACYTDIHSSHVRNFSMTADFGQEVWRYILLPVYLTAYRFENKVYQVMANGQTAVVAGQKPVAWWKVWLAVAALLLPGLAVGLVGLVLLLAGGLGFIVMGVGALLLVGGGAVSVYIYKQAAASEAA
jgi:Zn finger protein HypA/HybF involved in hydrogenase expression